MSASVLVAILNWHCAAETLECLGAVRRSRGVEVEVLVVDNGSTDGSAEELREALRTGRAGDGAAVVDGWMGGEAVREVRFLALPQNTGYAGGMNAALAYAAAGPPSVAESDAEGARWSAAGPPGEYVLLLTPDALVGPDTIARLVAALEADPGAAVAGPVVVYREGEQSRAEERGSAGARRGAGERLVGAGGAIDPRRVRAPLFRDVRGDEPYAVDWIDGCCMLLRRGAVAAVGGFDERYFLYFEETDLCVRLGQAGWRVLLVPGAEVLHEKLGSPPSHYYFYMNRNRYLFWRKNFGVHPARVALVSVAETGQLAASWLLSLLLPNRQHRRADDRERLARQLVGLTAGTRSYTRGRLGGRPAGAPGRG